MTDRIPECIEVASPGPHRASVIWLHGLGADGHDFEPIVAELRLPAGHGVRFVFPHAPERPVTVNGGMRMRAWYDIAGVDLSAQEDEVGIRASAASVARLIEREQELGIAAGRIVLAGFSQGGALALHAGLRQQARLAGIAVLSGYLPLAGQTGSELAAANRVTPVFQAHGEQDPIIPLALAERSRDRLGELRPGPAWHAYAMGHEVCGAEIGDLRGWLVDVLELVS